MTEETKASATHPSYDKRRLLTAHSIALISMWLITTIALVAMLFGGVRETGQFAIGRDLLQAAYVLVLLWYLSRSGPATSQLPELQPLIPRWRFSAWIPVLVILILFVMNMLTDIGGGILLLVILLTTVWILVAWRNQIRLLYILQGFALALIAFLLGLPLLNSNFYSPSGFYLRLGLIPLMYIAGGLLVDRTHLGEVQLMRQRYKHALWGIVWGCLLFIPLGLFNAASGSPGPTLHWVNKLWMPFSIPWFAAIVEETWFRLFLICLCYFLMRPAFPRHPAIAIMISLFFSALVFGLGHSGTLLENLLRPGLLYGLPMAVIFTRRDWEHAVGAHTMINLIPLLMVFLGA